MADSTTHPPVVAALVDSSPDATPSPRPEASTPRSPSQARPAPKPRRPAKTTQAKTAQAKGGSKRKQPTGRAASKTPCAAKIARSGDSQSTPHPAPAPSTAPQPPPAGATDTSSRQRSAFSQTELGRFRDALLAERERLLEEVAGLREESLLRHDEVNHEEDGTDAYIRLSGLDRAGQEQARVIQIDEALRTLDEGHYGICEVCGCCIETARLELLPFVTTCIRCQSEAEGGARARTSARARLWQ